MKAIERSPVWSMERLPGDGWCRGVGGANYTASGDLFRSPRGPDDGRLRLRERGECGARFRCGEGEMKRSVASVADE